MAIATRPYASCRITRPRDPGFSGLLCLNFSWPASGFVLPSLDVQAIYFIDYKSVADLFYFCLSLHSATLYPFIYKSIILQISYPMENAILTTLTWSHGAEGKQACYNKIPCLLKTRCSEEGHKQRILKDKAQAGTGDPLNYKKLTHSLLKTCRPGVGQNSF